MDPDEEPPCGPRLGRYAEPKLQKLTESDDVEHFLITFERVTAACQWPRVDWTLHLVPLLTGKTRGVHMDGDEALNYDRVKAAILRKYDINPERYRQRFRSLDVGPEESTKELNVRLKENYIKWKAAELADIFVAARRKTQQWSFNAWKAPREPRKPQGQHTQRHPQGFGKPSFQENPASESKPVSRVPVCYQCREEGHMKPKCPRSRDSPAGASHD